MKGQEGLRMSGLLRSTRKSAWWVRGWTFHLLNGEGDKQCSSHEWYLKWSEKQWELTSDLSPEEKLAAVLRQIFF
jgi:hypothetical protein